MYIGFVVVTALWSVGRLFANMAQDAETFFNIGRWTILIAIQVQLALLYHSLLLFVSPKGRLNYTLVPLYSYALIWDAIALYDITLVYGPPRKTLEGFVAGAGSLTPVINPGGFNLASLFFAILTFVVLIRFYISEQSPVVKVQAAYLLAGGLLIAGALQSFIITQILGGFNLTVYLQSLGLVIMLLGLRKHGFFAVTPVAEAPSQLPMKYDVKAGASYVGLKPDPAPCFEVFSDLIRHGCCGFCISRYPPDDIRQTYSLKTTPIRWLAQTKQNDAIAPGDLLGISLTVQDFVQKTERAVVMLHGLEYLVSINGYAPVLRLIQRLTEVMVQKQSILILPMVPGSLNEKEEALLIAETKRLSN